MFISFLYTVKPVHNGHPWDPEKVAVVQRVAAVQGLVQNSRQSHSRFSRARDSDRSLLTGGRCSEVAVSTGLTVHRYYYSSCIWWSTRMRTCWKCRKQGPCYFFPKSSSLRAHNAGKKIHIRYLFPFWVNCIFIK
jgi:hypothetical protein